MSKIKYISRTGDGRLGVVMVLLVGLLVGCGNLKTTEEDNASAKSVSVANVADQKTECQPAQTVLTYFPSKVAAEVIEVLHFDVAKVDYQILCDKWYCSSAQLNVTLKSQNGTSEITELIGYHKVADAKERFNRMCTDGARAFAVSDSVTSYDSLGSIPSQFLFPDEIQNSLDETATLPDCVVQANKLYCAKNSDSFSVVNENPTGSGSDLADQLRDSMAVSFSITGDYRRWNVDTRDYGEKETLPTLTAESMHVVVYDDMSIGNIESEVKYSVWADVIRVDATDLATNDIYSLYFNYALNGSRSFDEFADAAVRNLDVANCYRHDFPRDWQSGDTKSSRIVISCPAVTGKQTVTK